jgi:hypothetical protein
MSVHSFPCNTSDFREDLELLGNIVLLDVSFLHPHLPHPLHTYSSSIVARRPPLLLTCFLLRTPDRRPPRARIDQPSHSQPPENVPQHTHIYTTRIDPPTKPNKCINIIQHYRYCLSNCQQNVHFLSATPDIIFSFSSLLVLYSGTFVRDSERDGIVIKFLWLVKARLAQLFFRTGLDRMWTPTTVFGASSPFCACTWPPTLRRLPSIPTRGHTEAIFFPFCCPRCGGCCHLVIICSGARTDGRGCSSWFSSFIHSSFHLASASIDGACTSTFLRRIRIRITRHRLYHHAYNTRIHASIHDARIRACYHQKHYFPGASASSLSFWGYWCIFFFLNGYI